MDIRAEILREHSKAQVRRIADYVGDDPERFGELMRLFLTAEYRVTQRLAWVLSYCADSHPALIAPYVGHMLGYIHQHPELHDAVRRNVLRVLQWVQIPSEQQGLAVEVCFAYLTAPHTPVAIKAFAMTVLDRIAREHPELSQELKLVLTEQLPYQTAAFVSRAKQLLKNQ